VQRLGRARLLPSHHTEGCGSAGASPSRHCFLPESQRTCQDLGGRGSCRATTLRDAAQLELCPPGTASCLRANGRAKTWEGEAPAEPPHAGPRCERLPAFSLSSRDRCESQRGASARLLLNSARVMPSLFLPNSFRKIPGPFVSTPERDPRQWAGGIASDTDSSNVSGVSL
jgi:hypothetical protein